MADDNFYFLNAVNLTASNTPASQVLPTADLRDLAFYLYMPAAAGAGTDTLDIIIQESDQEEFTDAERIRTLATFTQVLGNGGAATQKLNVTDSNVAPYLRARTACGGVATVFDDVTVMAAYNLKV